MLAKIAITGNTATGKTEALKIFKKLGSYTLNADDIAHKLLKKKDVKIQIIKSFGKKITANNKINREKLASIVFKDKEKLKKLEKILHPQILSEIEKKYKNKQNKSYKFFVVEMPLLFEIGAERLFDFTITISLKEDIAKKRYKGKDYKLRKKRQMSSKKKEKLSDFVINNNQNLSCLKENIKKISNIINRRLHESRKGG